MTYIYTYIKVWNRIHRYDREDYLNRVNNFDNIIRVDYYSRGVGWGSSNILMPKLRYGDYEVEITEEEAISLITMWELEL